jgi:probable HAF family extracellular repeat protein
LQIEDFETADFDFQLASFNFQSDIILKSEIATIPSPNPADPIAGPIAARYSVRRVLWCGSTEADHEARCVSSLPTPEDRNATRLLPPPDRRRRCCESGPQVTQPPEASVNQATLQYTITKLPNSLGGTVNRGTAINNRGLVAGFSNLAGNLTRHAALFRDGSIVDLGTLGGANCPECNSSVVWPGINNQGLVVGIAETADLDPLGEAWSCTAFFPSLTGHICRGFVWKRAR